MTTRSLAILTILIATAAVLLACTEAGTAIESESAVRVDETGGPIAAAVTGEMASDHPRVPTLAAPDLFIAHEWGTFTSVQASDGRTMEGVHRTEELLPAFVHGRDKSAFATKSVEALPEPVTQKLETPVIYFYTDEPLAVHVDVAFPEGVISEWYPSASTYEPALFALDRIAEGRMAWDVRLEPGPIAAPPVSPDEIWAPSRNVPAAVPVKVGDEEEHFIFYRGLGRFEVPFVVRHDAASNELVIRNNSDQAIPAVFLLNSHPGGGGVTSLGAIDPMSSIRALPGPKELDFPDYLESARDHLFGALVESGLYEDEALAMIDTWNQSYFLSEGLRVLYIVPDAWTAELLPIAIEPAPDELVRTLVGRVEVMTHDLERDLVARLEAAAYGGPEIQRGSLGRFAEPHLRRALELISDPVVLGYAHQVLVDL